MNLVIHKNSDDCVTHITINAQPVEFLVLTAALQKYAKMRNVNKTNKAMAEVILNSPWEEVYD